ncbi:thioredoxin [Desertibaculum subflavum]|uniref:thioredoxin n=1 Tax=Desertibaculum subflavum TaxID=2268458 RepID=UPI000E66E954
MQPNPAETGAVPTDGLIKDADITTFMNDVVNASLQTPVMVDFWAPWCGPCKTLTPILEKVVTAAGGKVKLVKVNIDDPKNQPLAQQMRISSIPAVYAFKRGQPVDGFMGALPESQVKQFVAQLIGGAVGPTPAEALLAEAKAALEQGDAPTAQEIFQELLQIDPASPDALAGLAKMAIEAGEFDAARELLDKVRSEHGKHAEVQSARAALDVAEQATRNAGPVGELRAKVAENPADHQSRFDLAMALYAAGERAAAVDELLEVVRRDRKWNDDGARKQLVQFFEAMGFNDPLSVDGRKRLSQLLFR